MEDHEGQSAKNLAGEESTSPRGMNSWRFQNVLNANCILQHERSSASRDFKKENSNVQFCIEFEWNFWRDR